MNLKQKLYDLKGQQKALVPELRAMVDSGDLGEDYQAKNTRFDELGTQIKAIETQLAREGMFDEGDPTPKDFTPGTVKAFANSAPIRVRM